MKSKSIKITVLAVVVMLLILPFSFLLAGCGEEKPSTYSVDFSKIEEAVGSDYYIKLTEKNTSYSEDGEVVDDYEYTRELTHSDLNGDFYKVAKKLNGETERFSLLYPDGSPFVLLASSNLEVENEPTFEKFEKNIGVKPSLEAIFLNGGWTIDSDNNEIIEPDFENFGIFDFVYESVEDITYLGRECEKYNIVEMTGADVVGYFVIDKLTQMPLALNGTAYEKGVKYQTIIIETTDFEIGEVNMPASQIKIPFFQDIQNVEDFGLTYVPQLSEEMNLVEGHYESDQNTLKFVYSFGNDIYAQSDLMENFIDAGLVYYSLENKDNEGVILNEIHDISELATLMQSGDGELYGYVEENANSYIKFEYSEGFMKLNFIKNI